jgi:peptide/nickel transport system permease protein
MKCLRPKNIQLGVGAGLLGVMLLSMGGVVLLYDFSIELDMAHRLEPASSAYLLGTDDLGRDVLSCVVYGAWISLLIGAAAVGLSAVVGTVLGLISGYAGGLLDGLIMRLVDVIMAFPGILLALALASFLTPGIATLIGVLAFAGWGPFARLIRGEVLKYKQREFILAAKSYNASFWRILFFHLLPLILPLLFIQASLAICGVILAESSLNFLGVGLKPEIPTLGQLLDAGRGHLFDRPGLMVIPGLVLFGLIMAFHFIGEGLRSRFTR